jgi:hypothetical protein
MHVDFSKDVLVTYLFLAKKAANIRSTNHYYYIQFLSFTNLHSDTTVTQMGHSLEKGSL